MGALSFDQNRIICISDQWYIIELMLISSLIMMSSTPNNGAEWSARCHTTVTGLINGQLMEMMSSEKKYSPWISFWFVVSTEVKEKELEIDIFWV